MPQTTLQAIDIKGLTPAIDAVNSDDTFVLDGKNFVFDSLGPKSGFGSVQANGQPIQILDRRGVQIIREGAERFLCTNSVIYRIIESSHVLEPLLQFEAFTNIHRWTHAFLNGIFYFCHPGIGILYWDERTNARGLLDVPGLPAGPIAVVEDSGRLAVMNNTVVAWSGPSNGFAFTPQLGGSGFQVISDRISGDPVMISSFSRGLLTWTNQGVMRSEFTGGVEVYRHRGINTELHPINSFCVARINDDTSVILDQRGLFASRGEPPTPFKPLFNEFLIEELKGDDSLVGSNTRMEWDPFSRRIYILRSFAVPGVLYSESYALYEPLDRWGFLNQSLYGIGHGFWVDENGFLMRFAGTPFNELSPTDSKAYSYAPRKDYPQLAQRQRQSQTLSSTIRVAGLPESQNAQLQTPGLYAFDASAKLAATKEGLDSHIVVGHIRVSEGEGFDELSQIINTAIGSVKSREISTADVDYNLVPDGTSDEDYNTAIGVEDFGINPVSFINFALDLLGSNDGVSEFSTKIPTLERFHTAMRYYSGGPVGIWHQAKLTADTPGEFYHLRSLHVNAIPAGRLM